MNANQIYDLTNASTGSGPIINGINEYLGSAWTISNNQITLTNGDALDNPIFNNNSDNKLEHLTKSTEELHQLNKMNVPTNELFNKVQITKSMNTGIINTK